MKDKSNVVLEAAKQGDRGAVSEIRWVVATPGSPGQNHAAHFLCTTVKNRNATQIANIITRANDNDKVLMGETFDDLKAYQRCLVQS
jgi:hypothetical protein